MPRVGQVDGASIYIYFADHNPPHFHARQAGSEALIAISSLAVLRGTVPSLREVLAWAGANQELLMAAWRACNPDKP